MKFATWLCVLFVISVLVSSANGKKTFSTRRKSGGSNRRGGSTTNHQKPPPPQPATPHRTDTTNTNFLNFERAGSSHSSGGNANTHNRGNPFNNPDPPKQSVPQTNGPIGFEKLNNNQGNQKLGFDKVNSEVQQKHNAPNVPAAPPYPGGASYPKPAAGAPNGPPPAYPGYGSATSSGGNPGGFEPPPAYPGRPMNAPPVYSASNPSYGQKYPGQNGGYPNQQGGYPNQQGGYPNQQGGYPNQHGGYPVQPGGYQQNAYPQQHGSYPGQSYPGQQNFGHPNTGSNFGNYPNTGYNQGFGSHSGFGNPNAGGYGNSYPGYGGNQYGGSPFGNSFGGSPFGSGHGSNSFGGGGFGGLGGNSYSPNNFGFSNNPGFFGSSGSGGYNNYGYRKKSRFGGLPIPIPIPIPIPFGGGFGGGLFGGRSHNHRVLDTFVKDTNISSTDNTTTNIYILNNSTVTPCTSDQFIYDSLNITVLSCTAGNCTAIKVFTTSNISGEVSVNSAGITMCLEQNTTYSSFADNINPKVSGVNRYWMEACKEIVVANSTENGSDVIPSVTIKFSELNNTETTEGNTTTGVPSIVLETTPATLETSTVALENSTVSALNSTLTNSASSDSSLCETFECSWIEMCLPSIETVDRCASQDCPQAKTRYEPCVRIKMCKSPSTPISTFATLNTTLSRIDQFDNITSVSDIFNLTLISYIPPPLPSTCSQNATDPSCQISTVNIPQEVFPPGNYSDAATEEEPSSSNNATLSIPALLTEEVNSSEVSTTTSEAPTPTPAR